MGVFILNRIFYGIIVLFGTITVVFILFTLLPGDPARLMLGQNASRESIAIINKELGRDKPYTVQYLMYLNDLSPISFHNYTNKHSSFYLDKTKYNYTQLFLYGIDNIVVLKFPFLRRSYQNKQKVVDIIESTLPSTLILAISAMIIATCIGIPIGILAAINKDSFFDKASLFFSILWMSGPSFYIGLLLAYFLGNKWSDITHLNFTGSLFVLDESGSGQYLEIKNLILPSLTLGLRPLAIIIQLTRNSMLDILSHDYIRTAYAKGLRFYNVIFRHALKNALVPVSTAITGWFAGLVAGSVFVEEVFNWKGLGQTTVYALQKNDLPVVMGSIMVVAIIFVIINTTVDIFYGILDPRVRIR